MNIYIGADHRGFKLKNALLSFYKEKKINAFDAGSLEYDAKDDYPDIAKIVAESILHNDQALGIIICGSGAGVCIAANRLDGIRAVETHDPKIAKASRKDDNTNMLCLGADFISEKDAIKVITAWLKQPFQPAVRRIRRIKKLDKII